MLPSDPPFKVKALYDYSSPHEDDLSFPADEVITVTAIEDDDWYLGGYIDKASGTKKEGIFPKNFVERIVVEVPARPVRTSRRKTLDLPAPQDPSPAIPLPEKERSQAPAASPPLSPVPADNPIEQPPLSKASEPKPPPPPPVEEPKHISKPVETPKPPPAAAKPPPTPAPAPAAASLPSSSNKPPPPDKPSSSSFKDRLALFNKSGAVPVTPFNPLKPRTEFVKKPFVPAPPSKNAYVPAPISHAPKLKRDEEARPPPVPPPVEPSVKASGELDRDLEENKPKQSLKERIAMLQTQQLDPHALPIGKPKPKPKPKKVVTEREHEDTETVVPHSPAGENSGKLFDDDAHVEKGLEVEDQPVNSRKRSVDVRKEDISDDMSVGDGEGSSISFNPNERLRHQALAHQSDFGDDEGANDTPDAPDSEDDEEEDTEELDPEVQRKIALRERMMKMSGGMGMMHGMFGPPPVVPMGGGVPAKRKKSTGGRSVGGDDNEEHEERSPDIPPPIPVLPFALPKAQSPSTIEQDSEGEEDVQEASAARKIPQDLSSDEAEGTQPVHPHGPRSMPPRSPTSIHESGFTRIFPFEMTVLIYPRCAWITAIYSCR